MKGIIKFFIFLCGIVVMWFGTVILGVQLYGTTCYGWTGTVMTLLCEAILQSVWMAGMRDDISDWISD